MKSALTGVKVLDLSRFVAGPYCSTLLADMGADVIKVENRIGEDTRKFAPFKDDFSLYFASLNRNKKGMSLDFRTEEGRDILLRLIEQSDVLLENFRPGTLEKMGLGKSVLEKINPSLVVTSVSGYGQTGPYKDRIAFDSIIQAASGIMGLTGAEDGEPTLVGFLIMDFMAAMYATIGTVCALYHKKDTGEGQYVDISMLDNGLTMMMATGIIPHYLVNGEAYGRHGNRDRSAVPCNTFRAKDGFVHIHAGTDPVFERFARLIQREELLQEDSYKYLSQRLENIPFIEGLVAEWVKDKNAEEAEEILGKAGIMCREIMEVAKLSKSPQLTARNLIEYVEHRNGETIPVMGVNIKMSRTQGKIRMPAPELGEHNEEICRELLGMDVEQIRHLQQKNII